MAACIIGVEKLLESNKCLVILSLCQFLSFLSAEQDVSESMPVLSFMKITFYTFGNMLTALLEPKCLIQSNVV